MRVVTLGLLLILLPRVAAADLPALAPITPVPPGDDVIIVMHKGDQAPFTGQLFDQPTAIRWANYLQQYKLRLQTDTLYCQHYYEAEAAYQNKRLELEREQYLRVTAELQDKNTLLEQELRDPPFYRTVWFGVTVGAVAMAGAVGLAAWGLGAVKK